MEQVEFLTLPQVCARIPGSRGAKQLSVSTAWRWILDGCRTRGGRRVRLAAVRVGNRWLVRPRDLDAFFDSLANNHLSPDDPPTDTKPSPSQAKLAKAVARAHANLEAAGC